MSIFLTTSYAQKKEKAFFVSEVKKGDLSNKAFKDYPASQARILFDYGTLNFKESENDFIIERNRHLRIKLLNDTLLSVHTLGLTSFEKDDVLSIKHYSLVDGDLAVTEISAKWASINKFRSLSKELTNVKAGDIVEFIFKSELDSPEDIPGWQFEYEIPVDYSELYAEVPGMFKYKPIYKGYIPFLLNTNELLKDNKKNWVEIDGFYVYQYRFLIKDIPPFEKVIYSPSSRNYLTSVDFYLEEIKAYKDHKAMDGQSWDQVSTQLYNDEKLEGRINKFEASNVINELTLDSNIENNIVQVYDWVSSSIVWNGDIGIYAEHDLNTVIENRSGSIAEINLLLSAILRKIGVISSPLILRTSDQGELNMELPSSSQFNYLICWVDLSGYDLLLDASDPCLDVGILRPSSLNNKGLKITPRFEDWIDLEEERVAKYKAVTNSSVNNSSLLASVSISKLNYYAIEDCRDFNNVEELVRIEPGIVIDNVSLSRKDSIFSGNRILFDCNADSLVDKTGSSWSFVPFWFERVQSSPFKAKERKFPIVFPYLFEYNWIFTLSYDSTITVSEIPKEAEIVIPDNTLRFFYKVVELDGVLQINAQLSILRRRFHHSDYEVILEFYDELFKKFNEEIKIKVRT